MLRLPYIEDLFFIQQLTLSFFQFDFLNLLSFDFVTTTSILLYF